MAKQNADAPTKLQSLLERQGRAKHPPAGALWAPPPLQGHGEPRGKHGAAHASLSSPHKVTLMFYSFPTSHLFLNCSECK